MTLLEELASLMAELDLGVFNAGGSAGGTIFLSALPSSPDRCMAVALYAGSESEATDTYDEPSIQIRIRGTASDSRIAEGDAQRVYDAIHAIGSRTLAGGTWLQDAIGVNGGPVYIGRDGNGRHEYVCNFRAEISRTSTNRSYL